MQMLLPSKRGPPSLLHGTTRCAALHVHMLFRTVTDRVGWAEQGADEMQEGEPPPAVAAQAPPKTPTSATRGPVPLTVAQRAKAMLGKGALHAPPSGVLDSDVGANSVSS